MSAAPSARAAIDAEVTIQRPPAEVFAFYRDFQNLPLFLGDVIAVESLGNRESRWTIQGPWGIVLHWTVSTTDVHENTLICYETKGPRGLRTGWEVEFSPTSRPGETRVHEKMSAPFGAVGRAALAWMGKPPLGEVRANLNRLKQVTETGEVTDTTYAVPGKFRGP
ncbi:Polyketide cyclase / dehydrase and lipid transport [Streptomyces sp. DvalAA-14]|uniref:SRPBCC family protein n=1 Tax=unclassified Streptomyces TaxID=2593676 RepID=UPI00081B7D25|nr:MULTISPECIES: SRPBCC family protein [unclassified Streptomyces]MYS21791.1 hypothetical protein [Streptomyces sp. SID4948]SCE01308.1 Polyketide cyclase / dehydrase and lipid transport [Streptomyces sp. DvalAA-14]